MDLLVDYARFIGKNTSQLTFSDMLKMIDWGRERYKSFAPIPVRRISYFIKKEVRE